MGHILWYQTNYTYFEKLLMDIELTLVLKLRESVKHFLQTE